MPQSVRNLMAAAALLSSDAAGHRTECTPAAAIALQHDMHGDLVTYSVAARACSLSQYSRAFSSAWTLGHSSKFWSWCVSPRGHQALHRSRCPAGAQDAGGPLYPVAATRPSAATMTAPTRERSQRERRAIVSATAIHVAQTAGLLTRPPRRCAGGVPRSW